jgi:hypothetical protein
MQTSEHGTYLFFQTQAASDPPRPACKSRDDPLSAEAILKPEGQPPANSHTAKSCLSETNIRDYA